MQTHLTKETKDDQHEIKFPSKLGYAFAWRHAIFALLVLPVLAISVPANAGTVDAATNRLDLDGLDETVRSEFGWIATAHAGIEHAVGPATAFATGGLAAARIANSVTDIDFGPDMPARIDPDDSFRNSSTEFGWLICLGVEVPLADAWTAA